MPVSVHIPVRLRLDRGVLAEADDTLDEALTAALDRALANCRSTVLEPRGGYARVALHPPSFSWSGDGLAGVDARTRQDTEALVARIIADAVASAGLDDFADRAAQAPEVAPASPYERYDPTRALPIVGYLLDSYGGPETRPKRRVAWFESPDAALDELGDTADVDWWVYTNDADFHAALFDLVKDFVAQRGRSSLPGPFSVLYRRAYGHKGYYWIAVLDVASDDEVVLLQTFPVASSFGSLKVVSQDLKKGVRIDPIGVTRFSTGLLEYIPGAKTGGPIVDAIEQYLAAGQHALLDHPPAELKTVAEREDYRRKLHALLREQAERVQKNSIYPQGALALLRFDTGKVAVIIPSNLSFMPMLVLPLTQVRTRVDPAKTDAEGPDGQGLKGASDAGGMGPDDSPGQEQSSGAADAAGGDARVLYPVDQGDGAQLTLELSSFLGEPAVEQLGHVGDELLELMRRIAYRLGMPIEQCHYAGAFCIAAAHVLGARGHAIASYAAGDARATQPGQLGRGNLGAVDFQPEVSEAIRFLRYLAGTAPLISSLAHLIDKTYPRFSRLFGVSHQRARKVAAAVQLVSEPFGAVDPDDTSFDDLLSEDFSGNVAGWLLRFHGEVEPAMEGSVGWLFMYTCQVVLLQLCRASHEAIQARLEKFGQYFPVFEMLVSTVLRGEADLREMREQLNLALSNQSFSGAGAELVKEAYHGWTEARRALSLTLHEQILMWEPKAERLVDPRAEPQIVFLTGGGLGVRDTSGRVWTLAELDQAIAIRSQTARGIDPLVQQITNIPDVVELFSSRPDMARTYLADLLLTMLVNNNKVTKDAEESARDAFRISKLREDIPGATVPGTGVMLQGVHLLAHQAIGDAFQGDSSYSVGLDSLFRSELGRESLITFFEVTGVLLLSVICPPAGFLAGAVVAGAGVVSAYGDQTLYRSLIDPEVLMSRADMELELFMAEFGAALAIIPDAGSIISKAMQAGKTIGRTSVSTGLRITARRLSRELMATMAAQLRNGLVKELVVRVVTDQIMGKVISQVMEPAIKVLSEELSLGSAGAPGGGPAMPDPPEAADELMLLERLVQVGQVGEDGDLHANDTPPEEQP